MTLLRRSTFRAALVALVALVGLASWTVKDDASAQGSGSQWYKVDLHHHSAFSAEAFDDLGIISKTAKDRGYNAIFLTDHNLGSGFPISSLTANHMVFEDSYRRWELTDDGAPTSTTNELATSPVNTGTHSLHLAATAAGYGETGVWTRRGPNLRSGDAIVQVAIRPTQIDPGSGIYISASFGGDPTVEAAEGYTTEAGAISPGKSTVMVWQLGTPRTPSTDPNARVLTYPLGPYTLNEWNTYTINLTDALDDIPAADRPVDYNGLTYLKIAAAGNGGTAEAFVDSYAIDASAPVPAGDEYVYRNGLIDDYDTADFRMFPSVELGVREHAGRFNFSITNPSEFVSHFNGADGIPQAQASGYPAMLNHPGDDGGLETQESIDTQAAGADLVEIRKQEYRDIWDAVLGQGPQVMGGGSTDTHRTVTANSLATFARAPGLTLDELIRAVYEGQTYVAQSKFTGRMLLTPDTTTTDEPFPARYPLRVSSDRTSTNVRLRITAGLATGNQVRWIRNGAVMATDTVSGASYDSTKSLDLAGSSTYVRAELLSSTGALIGLTQPIRFTDVVGLPNDQRLETLGVKTADGRGYTKTTTKGVTNATWSDPTLSLALDNPVDSLVSMRLKTNSPLDEMQVDGGAPVPAAADLAAHEAAQTSSWFYDGGSATLHLKVLHAQAASTAALTFQTGEDTEDPSIPGNLAATATGAHKIALDWDPSTDNVGVAGYTVRRNGAVVTTVGGSTTDFEDTELAADTEYSYTVDAFDAAGNTSAEAGPVTARTRVGAQQTFNAVADTYVRSDQPTLNFGSELTLRTDNSPVYRTYLRFNLQGVSGDVEKATLRLRAKNTSSIGYEARGSVNDTWQETTLNHNNQPGVTSVTGSSGATSSGTWSSVDVTPLVTGNGSVSVAVTTTSNSTISFDSRESAFDPELVVETSSGSPPDTEAPSTPANLVATATGSSTADLDWDASTDNVGVEGYTVRRDGVPVATVFSGTSYSDSGLAPGTTYSYTVDAFDAAENHSAESAPDTATTEGTTTQTFNPVADTYVNESSPSGVFGGSLTLRADNSPLNRSYLRFNPQTLNGTVESATLRVRANTAQSTGHQIFAVADNSWTEALTNYNNAPTPAPTATGSSGPIAAGTYTSVDVTSLVSGNGPVSFALSTASSTAVSYSSREGAFAPELVIETSGGDPPDTEAPTKPANLNATAAGSNAIGLTWDASTDNVGVDGYTVRRDGAIVTTVTGTTFTDTGLAPGTAHSYTVDAFDEADNHSPESDPDSATTDPVVSQTFVPVADTYVNETSPATVFGSSLTLRADGSPVNRSYLRFDPQTLSGTVTKATLHLRANTALSAGHQVFAVADNLWTEALTNYILAPTPAPTATGSSGPIAAGTWTSVDITSLVSGNGPVSFAVSTASSTAVSYSSREGAFPPELVIETASGPPPDTQPPTVPSNLNATAIGPDTIGLSWDASTDNVGVTGYTVRRDGAIVGTALSGTTYTDTGLTPNTTYSYTVDAFDAADNHSAESTADSATTLPPSPP